MSTDAEAEMKEKLAGGAVATGGTKVHVPNWVPPPPRIRAFGRHAAPICTS